MSHVTRRIAMGAALLLLAVTASSCGTALPTAPAVDSGVSMERSAQTTSLQSDRGLVVIDDNTPPSGGPGINNQPAGEEIVPSPGTLYKGTRTGWFNNPHRRHNH